MRDGGKDAEAARKLRIYLVLVLLLVVLAALSFLIVPQGSSVGSCGRLVFASSKYACITGLALSQENASLCGYAGTMSDSCYMQVAEKTNSAGTCGSISNKVTFSECVTAIASANEDFALCSQAREPFASECASGVAVALDNTTLCDRIGNFTYSAECSSIVGIHNAEKTGNPAYCLNVSRSTNKNLTAYILANVSAGAAYPQNSFALGTLSLLPNVTFTASDYCYTSLATRFYNPLLCANVSSGEASVICREESSAAYSSNTTANYTQLLAECSNAGGYAQQCTQSVMLSEAVKTKNATICASLASGLSSGCYSLLAATYKNASYCSYILNASAKSSCVANS